MRDYMRFALLPAGFTGTRHGISSPQRENLLKVLCDLMPFGLHHGDCEGADYEAHMLARMLRIPVTVHPPSDRRFRAFCEIGFLDSMRPMKPYLERDRDIIAESSFLIAVPQGERPKDTRGSGTWTTVKYAEEAGMGTIILHPDGPIQVDGKPVLR